MANISQTVANMVQGVSQQSAQERRNTQCEAQFDCLNQAVQGAVARPGFQFVKKLDTGDWTDAFFYDISRSRSERYVVGVKAGVLKAWNLVDGTTCTITGASGVTAYLAAMSGGLKDWNNWSATTANDTSFFANKQILPAMDTTKSPTRPPEALFWFRAGGYEVQYTIGIHLSGTWYNWSYTTPDNSVAGNAQYIATNALCYALYNAMVTDITHPIGTSGTGHLGFNIERVGNIIRLWRTDGVDFDITTQDGLNNTQLTGIKNNVGGLDQLPVNGFDGMLFKVAGDVTDTSDDWYVQFDDAASSKDSTTQGAWEEVVNQNTFTNLKASTMPMVLYNSALNTFALSYGTWGTRLAGDGIDSAVQPSFIGVPVQDIFYDQTRLAVMTAFSVVWSRVKNPFVFFPDTAQVALDTAPIDVEVQQTKGIAILKRPVQTNGNTLLWAEDKQLVVSHGDNSIFANATIEIDPSSSYAWNEDVQPVSVGTSLLFATSDDNATQVTDVTYQDGQVVDDTSVTDHVPSYIPADARELLASDLAKKAVLWAPSTPNMLYIYEYRKSKTDRLQSSWQTWRLPANSTILHGMFDRSTLYLMLKRPDGLHEVKLSVAPNQVDPEGSFGTRLDMMATEAGCTVSYSSGTGLTSIVLPYQADDVSDWLAGASDLIIVCRLSDDDNEFVRGEQPAIASVTTTSHVTTIKAEGDISAMKFYVGFRVRSERRESTFYKRDDQTGYVYLERIGVMRGELLVQATAYTRIEQRLKDDSIRYAQEFEGKILGQQSAQFDMIGLSTTKVPFSVGLLNEDFNTVFINDTPFPSAWQGYTMMFQPTIRTATGSQ